MRNGIALAFASTFSATAVAADYPPVYQPVVVPPVAVARVYDWTGVYIGANGGYGWAPASATLSLSNPFFFFNGVSTGRMAGGLAGGQIGANYQKGIAVIGLELDGQWSGQQEVSNTACGFLCTINETVSITAFGTARARFGIAFDNILIYTSAGVAWTSAKDTATATAFGFAPITLTLTGSKVGWTIAEGIEIGFTDNLSAKLEFLYIATDQVTGTTAAPAIFGGGTITETANIRDSIVRVGLNYRFRPF